MVSVVSDALEGEDLHLYSITHRVEIFAGHSDAWNKAEVLHRDVSDGNILIVIDQKRRLTNREAC